MRDKIPEHKKCLTHTVSCLPREWEAIHRVKKKLGIHTPFDVFRHAVSTSSDRAVQSEKAQFEPPRTTPAPRRKPKKK